MKAAQKRPVLKIPLTRFEWLMEAVALLGLTGMLVLLAYHWPTLPDRLPHHFNAAGHPDAWGPKSLLLSLPAVPGVIYLALTILQRFPHVYNYVWPITPDNARAQYLLARQLLAVIKVIEVWTFSWILWCTIRTALGAASGLGPAFLPLSLMAIFGSLAAYLVRARQLR